MSKLRPVKLNCPNCGKEFETSEYDSINVSINPELKDKVLDGSIFDYECPKCHEIFKNDFPFLYHDMSKNRMIFYNRETVNLLETLAELNGMSEKGNGINYDLKTFFRETKITGVRSPESLISEIVAEDAGLDRKAVAIYCALSAVELEDDSNGEMKVNECYLSYSVKGGICIDALIYDTDVVELVELPFDRERCEKIYAEKKKYVDLLSNDFIFDSHMGAKIINLSVSEEKTDSAKKKEISFCIIETSSDRLALGIIPEFNSHKLPRGEEVAIMKDGMIKVGRILNLFTTTEFDCPFDVDDTPYVAWKVMKEVLPLNPEETAINQLNALTSDPLKLRKCMVWVKPDEFMRRFTGKMVPAFSKRGLRRYFIAHVNNSENTDGCNLYNFDDLAGFVLSLGRAFSGGIILTDGKDELIISISKLLDYKTDRIMLDSSAMKELLEKLNEDEKKYLGVSYDAIYKAYTENTNPKKIAEDLRLSDEEVSFALSYGYRLLKYIIWDNYFSDTVSKDTENENC